jgi:hypothetical protein
MNDLNALANASTQLTADHILYIVEKIGQKGDIILLKHDGPRTASKYTVCILSGDAKFEAIRIDHHDLSFAVKYVLAEYLKF